MCWMVLDGAECAGWFWMVLNVAGWFWMVLNVAGWSWMVSWVVANIVGGVGLSWGWCCGCQQVAVVAVVEVDVVGVVGVEVGCCKWAAVVWLGIGC